MGTSIEITPDRLVFQKIIRDHGGPGVDVHREFVITENLIRQVDDGQIITEIVINPLERARWISACRSGGYQIKL
jgi:hypothetical protein